MQINKDTTIPLWSVFAAVPTIVGFILWISYIAYTSSANADQILDLKKSKDAQFLLLMDIKTDVVVIKERIMKKEK